MPVSVPLGDGVRTEGSEANMHDGPAAERFLAAVGGRASAFPLYMPRRRRGEPSGPGRSAAEHHVVFGRPIGHIAPGSLDLFISSH
jgi:hypothetical protein